MTAVPKHLYQCGNVEMQKAWIKRALLAGRTLSDSGLWLAGVDRPEQVVAALRADGLAIETTTASVVDAADETHDDLAWRLPQSAKQHKGVKHSRSSTWSQR